MKVKIPSPGYGAAFRALWRTPHFFHPQIIKSSNPHILLHLHTSSPPNLHTLSITSIVALFGMDGVDATEHLQEGHPEDFEV
jgi:hypothetical protein